MDGKGLVRSWMVQQRQAALILSTFTGELAPTDDTDVASGRLQQVLPDWRLRSGGIHAVFPAARFRPANVTRFTELMVRSEAGRHALA